MDDDEPIRALLKSHNIEAPPYLDAIVADIAERYRQAVSDHSESHRITDIANDLAAIAETATRLSNLLEHLHPETYALMAGDWYFPGQLHPIDREEMTEHIPLVELAPDNSSRAEIGLLRTLKDFGKFAREAHLTLGEAWCQRRDDGKLDLRRKLELIFAKKCPSQMGPCARLSLRPDQLSEGKRQRHVRWSVLFLRRRCLPRRNR